MTDDSTGTISNKNIIFQFQMRMRFYTLFTGADILFIQDNVCPHRAQADTQILGGS